MLQARSVCMGVLAFLVLCAVGIALPAAAANCPLITRTLQVDDSGADVSALQTYLMNIGYLKPVVKGGYFDIPTLQAVQKYQATLRIISSGTPATTGWGIVGKATASALAACKRPRPTPARQAVARSAASAPSGQSEVGLTAFIAQLQASPPTQPPIFSRTLSRRASGTDVARLQFFLTQTGDYSAEITGHFGVLTEQAVQSFQARNSIVSSGSAQRTGYGAVGSRTRAAIASTNLSPPAPEPIPATAAPPEIVASNTSCEFNGQPIADGTSIIAYQSQNAPESGFCIPQTRICTNGVLSGDAAYQYPSCTGSGLACVLDDGSQIIDGSLATLYSQTSVASGDCSAISQSRTCTNGILSGDTSYQYVSCTTATSSACTLDGVELQNGDSQTYYSTQSVPFGSSCDGSALLRTCQDGTLSGTSSYQYAMCTVALPSSCQLDGATVQDSNSRTFYSARSVPFGQTCDSLGQSRVCDNGTLSGTSSYQYAICSVAPAPTSISANPNPCTITAGNSTCESTISWTASTTQRVQVWVTTSSTTTPNRLACTIGASNQTVFDITATGSTFKIYRTANCSENPTAKVADASVIVNGVQALASALNTAAVLSALRSAVLQIFNMLNALRGN